MVAYDEAMCGTMQAGPSTLEACLAREACYRVIGEVSPLPEQVNFVSWYQSELQTLLQVSTSHWRLAHAGKAQSGPLSPASAFPLAMRCLPSKF